jgi:hypothetical protein
MNIHRRVQGIGDQIGAGFNIAAMTRSPQTGPSSRTPGGGAGRQPGQGPVAQQLSASQWAAALAARQQQGGGANPANPNNTPGLPGYNPALPPNTPTGASPYGPVNPQNPYNMPGLPGYNPYQPTNPASGYNAANPYNSPSLPGYNPYAPSSFQSQPSFYGGSGMTAADFGLPSGGGGDPNGGSSPAPDLSYAFDSSAYQSYVDPMSQLGPWSDF